MDLYDWIEFDGNKIPESNEPEIMFTLEDITVDEIITHIDDDDTITTIDKAGYVNKYRKVGFFDV